MKIRYVYAVKSAYRQPMPVREYLWFRKGGGCYPRCPRCACSFEREYTAFCPYCGQKLDWSELGRKVIHLR